MGKYIDADKIRSEVERIQETGCESPISVCNDILSFIDFLQQEQPKVDLERDAVQFCFDKGLNITPYQAKMIASHFYELGQLEMRHRITNPEYNIKVVEQLKSEYPARKEDSYEIH